MTLSHLFAGAVRSFVVSAAISGTLLPAALLAQNAALTTGGHFHVEQDGKKLGTAQFSGQPVNGGYTLQSQGEMKLGSFSYKFQNQATVDTALNFVRDTLSGSVNGQSAHANDVAFKADTDTTGRNIAIQITGDGSAKSNAVDRHRNLVMVPDLDPAAYTLMAQQALARPQIAWVLIPKETGLLVPAEYTVETDVHGTVDGTPLAVKHMTATIGAENALTLDLFATEGGELLEADLDQQNIRVVRDGFNLTDRPKPAVPAQAAPPAEQGMPPAGQQPGAYAAPQPPAPSQPSQPPAPPQA